MTVITFGGLANYWERWQHVADYLSISSLVKWRTSLEEHESGHDDDHYKLSDTT